MKKGGKQFIVNAKEINVGRCVESPRKKIRISKAQILLVLQPIWIISESNGTHDEPTSPSPMFTVIVSLSIYLRPCDLWVGIGWHRRAQAQPGTVRGRLTKQRELVAPWTHVRACAIRTRRPGLSVNELRPRGAHASRPPTTSDPKEPDMSDVEWCA